MLLSIEAMKMETAIHAEADGVVAESPCSAATRSTPMICWIQGRGDRSRPMAAPASIRRSADSSR